MGVETSYAWVQQRRKEGASVEELAAELAARGLDAVEIDRLLDRDVRPRAEARPGTNPGWTMASPQLLLGILLLIGGVLLLPSGWILRASLLIILGAGRIATAWSIERPSSTQQDEARHQMLLVQDDMQPRCALHPAHAAMGTCPRCGSYCCALCTPGRGFAAGRVCMKCQALPEVEATRRGGASRGAAVALLSGPATIVLIVAIERVLSAARPAPGAVLVALAAGSAPWLVLAAVQANVRSGWPTVLSVVPWLAVELFLLLSRGFMQAGIWLIPLGVAVWGWVSTRQAARGEPSFISEA